MTERYLDAMTLFAYGFFFIGTCLLIAVAAWLWESHQERKYGGLEHLGRIEDPERFLERPFDLERV